MSWLRALKETARSGLKIERQRLEPLVAVRGAAGLALVVGAALVFFGPAVAVSSAFGAFQAAIATFQRSWRPRPVLALVSGATLAVSTFLGYLTGTHIALFVALLTLWTFLAGLAWTLGPTVGIIAASNVAIMLVTVTLPTSVAAAAGHAAMIAVGGIVQALLIVVFPVRRWGAQRDALADALAAEADYARRLRRDPTASFDPAPLMHARSAAAVTPREARRRPAELHGTRGVAERIRPVLASLADPAVGVPAEGPARDRVRELLDAAGTVLDTAAHAVRHGEAVRVPAAAAAALRTPDTGAVLSGPARRAALRLTVLLDDVVATARGAGTSDTSESGHRTRQGLLRLLPGALRAVRGELRPGSPVLRHAIRSSAVVAAGYLLGTVLPFGHGYWAPLTAVMVMRPDFSQTYGRSVARLCGTLVGVAVATAVVQAADPGTYVSAGIAVVCAFGMFLVMRTGYAAASVFISAYVVFLLGTGGEDWAQTVPQRVLLTLLGGLLAMLAYAVYPAWETPRLHHRLADWLLADGRYAAAVLDRYADPADTADVRRALLASRDARIAWREALKKARHEPVRSRVLSRDTADAAGRALAQAGRVAMLIEAHLPEYGSRRDTEPVPAAAALAEVLRHATQDAAEAVRAHRVPDWGSLHEVVDRWGTKETTDAVLRGGAVQLLAALDALAEALAAAPGRRRAADP
ncbi:FUSC family protein [Streptomyces peucetius]|uniref:FUSC family protein n=1 Tax=Streptomyces peucetius TaxID=1950 RepID=A0ABY6IA34_STRPE|nr:FUSC family protein [Streptomyces peucetius]UYQ63564.1 FUSC family protein [Streptomyces peucetius]